MHWSYADQKESLFIYLINHISIVFLGSCSEGRGKGGNQASLTTPRGA